MHRGPRVDDRCPGNWRSVMTKWGSYSSKFTVAARKRSGSLVILVLECNLLLSNTDKSLNSMNQLNCVSWLWALSTDPTNNLQLWSCYSLLHNYTDYAAPLFQHSSRQKKTKDKRTLVLKCITSLLFSTVTVWNSFGAIQLLHYSVTMFGNRMLPLLLLLLSVNHDQLRGTLMPLHQVKLYLLLWSGAAHPATSALSIPPQENCIKSENTDIHSDFSKWLHG